MSRPPSEDPPLPVRDESVSRVRLSAVLLWGALAAFLALGLLGMRAAGTDPQPDSRFGGLEDKFAWWEQHGGETELVFLGSSRVYRSIDPAAVERGLGVAGCAGMTSFNFGWPGTSAPLLMKIARRVAAAAPPPRGVRWVFIEPSLAIGPPLYLPAHPRSRYANDWSTLPAGFEQLWSGKIPGGFADDAPLARGLRAFGIAPMRALRFDMSVQHLRAFAAAVLGLGDWRRALFEPPGGPGDPESPELARRGFASLDAVFEDETGPVRERLQRRKLGPDDHEAFERYLDEMRKLLDEPAETWSGSERRLVLRLAEAARSQATRVGLLLTPTVDPRNLVTARRMAAGLRRAGEWPVLRFDPRRSPRLFAMDHWFDRGHMSERGAADYSTLVAARICRIVQSAKPGA